MNEHIELVKKWLDDHESVSGDELLNNMKSAYDASASAASAAYAVSISAIADIADAVDTATATAAVANATTDAATDAANNNKVAAKNAVEQYEQLTNRGE